MRLSKTLQYWGDHIGEGPYMDPAVLLEHLYLMQFQTKDNKDA